MLEEKRFPSGLVLAAWSIQLGKMDDFPDIVEDDASADELLGYVDVERCNFREQELRRLANELDMPEQARRRAQLDEELSSGSDSWRSERHPHFGELLYLKWLHRMSRPGV